MVEESPNRYTGKGHSRRRHQLVFWNGFHWSTMLRPVVVRKVEEAVVEAEGVQL